MYITIYILTFFIVLAFLIAISELYDSLNRVSQVKMSKDEYRPLIILIGGLFFFLFLMLILAMVFDPFYTESFENVTFDKIDTVMTINGSDTITKYNVILRFRELE